MQHQAASSINMTCPLFLSLLLLLPATAQADNIVVLDNDSLRGAVELWTNNPDEAMDIFGPIEEWDTSAVTDMR